MPPRTDAERSQARRIRTEDRRRKATAALRRRDRLPIEFGVLVAELAAQGIALGLAREFFADERLFRSVLGLDDRSVAVRIGELFAARHVLLRPEPPPKEPASADTAGGEKAAGDAASPDPPSKPPPKPSPKEVTACACEVVSVLFGAEHAARLRHVFDERAWPEPTISASASWPSLAPLSASDRTATGRAARARTRADVSRSCEKALLAAGDDAQRDLDTWAFSVAALAAAALYGLRGRGLDRLQYGERRRRRRLRIRPRDGLMAAVLANPLPIGTETPVYVARGVAVVRRFIGDISAKRVEMLLAARAFPPHPV